MNRMRIDIQNAPAELRSGLAEIMAGYSHRFAYEAEREIGFEPRARRDPGLDVRKAPDRIIVRYGRKTDAFRALGALLGESGPDRARDFEETPKFSMLGTMLDVSRNAVMRPDALKAFMRRLALMGINVLMLYTEDTYEVPGEPFFGYLRGRYTQDELRDLDRYADALGIEMFPCIQTLGHLEQILQWPAYAAYRDTRGVLLAEHEPSYVLIEKMIRAASAPFRSKRIHLGMDEAHGIGSGRYKELYGDKSAFDILSAYLTRVRDICGRMGLKPMIWSDMFFRIGSASHDYYDLEAVIPPAVTARIPQDVQLVYWDYYHDDEGFYADFIDRHRALGSEPIVAGGACNWNRFWTAMRSAVAVTDPCMKACKRKGVSEVFMTLWGDDGNECDIFSTLPALQFFCEHGYRDTVDENRLRSHFRGACDADYDAWFKASEIDSLPPYSPFGANPGKWLLWQDTAIGLLDPEVDDSAGVQAHYAALAEALKRAAKQTPNARRLEFPARIAAALAVKVGLRDRLVAAYRAGDHDALDALRKRDLRTLRKAVDRLWRCHRAMWLATYKPFGLEVVEQRYGGLRTRLESLDLTLSDYLAGRADAIAEFETDPLRAVEGPVQRKAFDYARAKTPSCIK